MFVKQGSSTNMEECWKHGKNGSTVLEYRQNFEVELSTFPDTNRAIPRQKKSRGRKKKSITTN